MTTRSIRESLQAELLDTQNLLSLIGDHPLMQFSLQVREESIKNRLAELPINKKEAKVALYFSGKPVHGSLGIDASFASQVLNPFQNMVQTDFVQRVHGKVGERGRVNDNQEAQLFITSLPRGSFGIELSKLESQNLFDDEQLADTLVHVTNLIEASAKSDEDFAAQLDETAVRTIGNLQDFLKVIRDNEAAVKIESGTIRCSLSEEEARIAYDRVSSTQKSENEEMINGVLRGILLDSWRFDFVTDEGESISGRINKDLTEEQVSQLLTSFFNNKCTALFETKSITFRNGKERKAYILSNLKDVK